VTLVGYDELHKWSLINAELGLEQPSPPAWFSTSPELFEALDIPADATPTVGEPRKVIGAKSISQQARKPHGSSSARRQSRIRGRS
jgi:hypothetical protein